MAKVTITFEDDPEQLTFCESLVQWHALAPFVQAAVAGAIMHDTNRQRAQIIARRVQSPIDGAAYLAQANYGLKDNTLGGGGTGKPPLIADDISIDCPQLAEFIATPGSS